MPPSEYIYLVNWVLIIVRMGSKGLATDIFQFFSRDNNWVRRDGGEQSLHRRNGMVAPGYLNFQGCLVKIRFTHSAVRPKVIYCDIEDGRPHCVQ
jgi:hypothetical protein